MYSFLDLILAVVVYLSPHDVKAIQMWPYASDTNSVKRELVMVYRKETNGWCAYGDCVKVVDGKMLDEQGKVLLKIKGHLQVTSGTNYSLAQDGWKLREQFSMVESNDERIISIFNGTNVIRQIRIKLWTTEPPVEFADCDPKHTSDLALLRTKLVAESVHCSEIKSAPKGISFGFYVDSKDFNRARVAARKIIGENSLTITLMLDARSDDIEDWKNGKKAGERHF